MERLSNFTSLHNEKALRKKHLEKTAHIAFCLFLYIHCHFFKLRAVKTLSKQFPEFKVSNFQLRNNSIYYMCPSSKHTKHLNLKGKRPK